MMMNNTDDSNKFAWQNILAVLILLGSYTVSIIWVVGISGDTGREGDVEKKVIRLVHSIADRDTKQAFDQLARDYEEIHPDVKVIVQVIPQQAYQQWVTTQCIGGTAPDILQAESTYTQAWEQLATRYMNSLTEYANKPNPYNKGTELEGLRWRDTYIDDMRAGFWDHLTTFFSVPFTAETVRIFYNKKIFKAATGSDRAPANFREWIGICEQINAYAHTEGKTIFPIAGTKNTIVPVKGAVYTMLDRYYFALTEGMVDKYDACYWGSPRVECALYGLYTGSFTINQDRVEAPFKLTRQIAQYCQPGFISNEPPQARFLFTQGKAAMIIGNVKDVKPLIDAADFEIGIFDFPLPTKDDPEYGSYDAVHYAEIRSITMHFCISRFSRYPNVAVDFMMFCTSLKKNEEFNNSVQWYPIIRTAKPLEHLRVFEPHIEGTAQRTMPLTMTHMPPVDIWFQQQVPRYVAGQISFDEFATGYEKIWLTEGARDFVERDRRFKLMLISGERNVTKAQSQMLFAEAGEFKAGQSLSERTTYQFALEVLELMEFGISSRAYTWHHLQKGDYQFP